MEFLRNGSAADLGALFQNQRLEAGFSQVKCGNQAIVAATEDKCIASFGHCLVSLLQRLKALLQKLLIYHGLRQRLRAAFRRTGSFFRFALLFVLLALLVAAKSSPYSLCTRPLLYVRVAT